MIGSSKAVLAIWVDIDPADDDAFNHWHSREHVQERVGRPGWLRGSRFKGVERPGRYLLFYDAESTAAFDSEAYYARLRNPTPLSRAIFPKFRAPWRTICSVEKDLRQRADRQIERAIVAFFWSVADARTARDRHAPSGEAFALQHTVSKGDLQSVS